MQGPLPNSSSVNVLPELMQNLFDYDGGNNVIYSGYAVQGASQNATVWTIYYFTYNGSGQCTSRQIAIDSWSNRYNAIYS